MNNPPFSKEQMKEFDKVFQEIANEQYILCTKCNRKVRYVSIIVINDKIESLCENCR